MFCSKIPSEAAEVIVLTSSKLPSLFHFLYLPPSYFFPASQLPNTLKYLTGKHLFGPFLPKYVIHIFCIYLFSVDLTLVLSFFTQHYIAVSMFLYVLLWSFP